MVYWRVPTAYSTASAQHQYAIDAHQYPTSMALPCLSLSPAALATLRPPRRHRSDALAARWDKDAASLPGAAGSTSVAAP